MPALPTTDIPLYCIISNVIIYDIINFSVIYSNLVIIVY